MALSIGDLEKYTVTSVEGLEEGKERGRGCYGAVYEVRLHGLPCIAKRLHDILVGRGKEDPVSEKDRKTVIERFREECELLSRLRHPNVVQFMGVHYGLDYGRDKADISLIMEYMHMDLDQCMKTYSDIPLPYKTSILRDVAYGLAYLHSIPIIHRDLNAGNVLLTESLRAKIADLGVAKLFYMGTLMHRTKYRCPGARDFMPPECLDELPKYNTQLDSFSFGHLTIYLTNQKAPVVIDTSMTPADVQNEQRQVGKRRRSLGMMGGPGHPLYSIAVQCLSDTPDQRPTSRELVWRMEEICKKQSLPYKNALQTLTENQNLREKLKAEKAESKRIAQQLKTDLKESQHATAELTKETKQLRAELQVSSMHARYKVNSCMYECIMQEIQKAVGAKQKRTREDDITLKEVKAKLMEQVKKNSELLDQFRVLNNHHVKLVEEQSLKDDHINAKQRQLEAKDHEIKEKDHEIKAKDHMIDEKAEELSKKELEIVLLTNRLQVNSIQQACISCHNILHAIHTVCSAFLSVADLHPGALKRVLIIILFINQ